MKKISPFENFLISILAFHVVPLLPIMIEALITGWISDKSLTITTAIYSAGMLACSRQIFLMGVYIIISLIQTSLYGALFGSNFSLESVRWLVIASLGFIFLTQVLERFQFHVLAGKQFWDS